MMILKIKNVKMKIKKSKPITINKEINYNYKLEKTDFYKFYNKYFLQREKIKNRNKKNKIYI